MTTTSPPTERTDLPFGLGTEYAADDEHRPLGSYVVLTGTFATLFAGGLIAAARSRGGLPERIPIQDVVMGGIATHKLSRLITKDKVTGIVRAPFTRMQERTGHGEVEEAPRGSGLRYAVGELLVCPYCIAQWIAGAFTVGYVVAPRTTRLLAATWTVHAIADGAQLAYSAAEHRS
jgi:hypothetical protein